MMRTLAGRLAFGGIAWIALWALALLLAFNVLLLNVLAGQVDAALRARAEAVDATADVQNGRLRITGDTALHAGASIYFGQSLVEGARVSPGVRQRRLRCLRPSRAHQLPGAPEAGGPWPSVPAASGARCASSHPTSRTSSTGRHVSLPSGCTTRRLSAGLGM